MDRRKFLRIGGTFLFVCAGAGLGPVLLKNRRVYGKSTTVMGTIAEIQVVHDDAHKAMAIIDDALEEVRRIEKIMSHFREDSEVGRINRDAFRASVVVSRETADVIRRGLHWSDVTNGAFDPGLGKIVELWDVKHRTEPPAQDTIRRLSGLAFHRHVRVTGGPGGDTVRMTSEDVRIDLGGIAKGYAADRAAEIVSGLGIDQALINLGGDLVALGGKSDGEPWNVGIRDPWDASRISEVLPLRNQAVATSGNYEQFFKYDGHLYHHIIDPKIAQPGAGGFASLSIIGNNCRDADALATGLFFLGDRETQRLLEDNTDGFSFRRLGT